MAVEDSSIGEEIHLPDAFNPEFALQLASELDAATRKGVPLKQVLPAETAAVLFSAVTSLLVKEPTLLEITPPSPEATVLVIGDTHGQLHDVIGPLLEATGPPTSSRLFVFNGDFVDRGAWGMELLAVLAAWKLALPGAVFLLRGNHESITCTKMYGFFQELRNKFGGTGSKSVFKQCKRMFAALPLAACIAGATLVLHGGLFRKPAVVMRGKKRRRKSVAAGGAVVLGSLDDLRGASKGGMDPSGQGATAIAADVMWSDPTAEAGLQLNDSRGVGLVFGADVTEQFLRENGLMLVIRSHEGPDARFDRDDMPPMTPGHSVDHVTESGSLWTVFSAPDYPQFQLPGERFGNLGAVLRLSSPDYATPDVLQFSASLPRPEAPCYYDLGVPDSDDDNFPELGGHASEMSSGGSSLGGSRSSAASSADMLPANGCEASPEVSSQPDNGVADEATSQPAAGLSSASAQRPAADGAPAEQPVRRQLPEPATAGAGTGQVATIQPGRGQPNAAAAADEAAELPSTEQTNGSAAANAAAEQPSTAQRDAAAADAAPADEPAGPSHMNTSSAASAGVPADTGAQPIGLQPHMRGARAAVDISQPAVPASDVDSRLPAVQPGEAAAHSSLADSAAWTPGSSGGRDAAAGSGRTASVSDSVPAKFAGGRLRAAPQPRVWR